MTIKVSSTSLISPMTMPSSRSPSSFIVAVLTMTMTTAMVISTGSSGSSVALVATAFAPTSPPLPPTAGSISRSSGRRVMSFSPSATSMFSARTTLDGMFSHQQHFGIQKQQQQQQQQVVKPSLLSLGMSVVEGNDDDGETGEEETDGDDSSSDDGSESVVVDEVITSDGVAVKTVDINVPAWKRTVLFWKYKNIDDDGLTFSQKLRKAGLSVVLSYGFVSNMSYCVSVSIAWYIFCKRTNLSPLAPGQWPSFLAVYSGFWVFNNVVRPVRFGASVALATQFDKVIAYMQTKFNVSKGAAIGLVVFLANIVGTTTLMCAGIAFASSLAGVPIRP